MNFTGLGVESLFGSGDDTDLLMMLVWILPVMIMVLYGQRIQLMVTSSEIKKSIKKLDTFRGGARDDLARYLGRSLGPEAGFMPQVDRFLDYFTIPPADMDPGGLVPKIRHVVRSREDYTRQNIVRMMPGISEDELNRVQTMLEIATTLRMLYRVVNHLFLTAKKQNNYPLILPLQMMLPFVMEEAAALRKAVGAFERGLPVGDGIGPMVVGRMMLNTIKEDVAFQTVAGRTDFEGRHLVMLKARGPSPTVGRPAEALEAIASDSPPGAVIMVDAALKFEGEDSATVAEGFGAAIGGDGTERFAIEAIAADRGIPVFAVVVKQSVREAVTVMTRDIARRADEVERRVREIVRSNTKEGDTVVVIGVGNTSGVPQ